ncbi:MAG: hypothetical protein D6812_16955, partial [Deltaproteobacteria bacterium]
MKRRWTILSMLLLTFLVLSAQGLPSCEQTYTIRYNDVTIGKVTAYDNPDGLTCQQNYSYSSASAHPKEGPTLQDSVAQFWLFQGSNGLCLFSVFGLEVNSSNGTAKVNYQLSGNGANGNVMLSDDNGELTESSTNVFKGRWAWGDNTDGGVIGPLSGSDWVMEIDVIEMTGSLNAIAFTSGNGIPIPI